MPIHPDDFTAKGGEGLQCVNPCQWRGRKWRERETATAMAGEYVPHHFKVISGPSKEALVAAIPPEEKSDDGVDVSELRWKCGVPGCGKSFRKEKRLNEHMADKHPTRI